MERTYKRGDMYYADLGKGIGSEQEGYRPVLIIQNNTGNRHSTTVIVAPISSKVDVKPKLPTHYFIDAECGLQLPSIVLLEQLRTVSKQRLEGYIGRLDKKHIRGVNHALAVSIGLVSPVPNRLNLFCYLFLGYPLEYRFHFFSAYIVPFHDNFCGWVLSGGSVLCLAVFAHKSAPLQ